MSRPGRDLNFAIVEHFAALIMRGNFVSQQIQEGLPSRYRRAELQGLEFVLELAAEDYAAELEEARCRAQHRWGLLVRHRAQQRALEALE